MDRDRRREDRVHSASVTPLSDASHRLSGKAWENGYVESFNRRFRDELLDGEIFYSLREVHIIIEECRRHYNTKRPHNALGYRPPTPETLTPIDQAPIVH